MHDLDTGKLRDLKFPSTWFENTPQGKFVLSMALGMAKYYVDHLSVTIRRGIRKKLRDGVYPNMPPPGYMNDPKTRTIVLNDERAPIVKRMFETYATGDYSGADIRRMATEFRRPVRVRGSLPVRTSGAVHNRLSASTLHSRQRESR